MQFATANKQCDKENNVLRHPYRIAVLAALCYGLSSASAIGASLNSEQVFPETTKGFLSVPDVNAFRDNWNKTQYGQLLQDPLMKPFAEDLRKQIQAKWLKTHERLGISWEDMEGVPGGEVSIAVIEPAKEQAATALLVDVTGHKNQATALLDKIDKNMTARGAQRSSRDAYGARITVYNIPRSEDNPARQAAFFLHNDVLGAADNVAVAEGMLGRLGREGGKNLASLSAFQGVMKRCKQAAGDLAPHARWWVEPFGYAEVARINNGGRTVKKGTDMLKILRGEGFEAIQGVGGYVNFSVDKYQLLHRTAVYAPASRVMHETVARLAAAGRKLEQIVSETGYSRFAVKALLAKNQPQGKYELAARGLQFPNGGDFTPPAWVPRELATYTKLNININEAFEASETLVNDYVNDEVFQDVLNSIQEDPNGPQIDIRGDLLAHLGNEVIVLSDYNLPITTKSERMLFAVKATNEKVLTQTVAKWMKSDPDARRREYKDYVIWEMVEPQANVPMVTIEGSPSFGGGADDEEEEEEERERLLPNSAVTVAHGHLMVASHIDFLVKVLDKHDQRDQLVSSTDRQIVKSDIDTLGEKEHCAEFFSRTDEEYRGTYELVRAGKMPESESMIGKLLNFMLGEGKEGVVRQQRIDGSKLPDFEAVRRYFGPAGMTITQEEDGWFATGFMLSKEG